MIEKLTKFKFYGRRKGKPLTAYRRNLLKTEFPKYVIAAQAAIQTKYKKDSGLRRSDVFFDTDRETWLEIGFGNGEFLSHMCQNYPDIDFIGCEPFVNGIVALLSTLENPVNNLRIWDDNARIVIDALPDQSLSRVYLLNPDPWPKSRHHKRRFVQPDSLDDLARILKTDGLFIMSSDHRELAEWMFKHTNAHDQFEWTGLSGEDWLTPPVDWPIKQTRYMKKAMAGQDIYWLIFRRKCRIKAT